MKKTKKTGQKGRKIYWRGGRLYAVCAACLAGLVCYALFLPQIVFQYQDRNICSGTALAAREDVNIALLNAKSEMSLYDRMESFAEGLANGREYYVSVHDMSPTSDESAYQKLYEDTYSMLPADMIYTILSLRSDSIAHALFNDDLQIEDWKQYVIYSDDYAEGVNFIIWYLKINCYEGQTMELLIDAQDHTLYGVKTGYHETTALHPSASGQEISSYEFFYKRTEEMHEELSELINELWLYLYYNYAEMTDEQQLADPQPEWDFSADDTLNLYMPYGEYRLNACWRTLYFTQETTGSSLPAVAFGFEEICRLIPPFRESF